MAKNESPEAADERKRAGSPDAERQKRLTQLVLRRSKLSDDEAVLLRDVFPTILTTHHDLVWNQLRKRGLASHDAKDLQQEVFADLHTYILEKGFPDTIPGLLYTITKRKLLDLLSTRNRAPLSVALPSSGSEKPLSGPDIDRAMDIRELARHIFPQLSPEHQQVIEKVVVNSLSHSEAAAVLGLAEGTVKSRVMAAKRALLELAETFLPSSQRGPS